MQCRGKNTYNIAQVTEIQVKISLQVRHVQFHCYEASCKDGGALFQVCVSGGGLTLESRGAGIFRK